MGHERLEIGQSFQTKSSFLKIQILVVDDDATSLAIVSAMLKTCCYQDPMLELSVVTVKNPLDALEKLRVQQDVFDLVVSDLHMPEMNGIELQKQVVAEFKLPVIIMSSDDKESVILHSLESGAVFYIVKPVNPDDLKNVWQYAVAARKGKSNTTREISRVQGASSAVDTISYEDINSTSSVNIERNGKKDSKKKGKRRNKEELEENNPVATKKAKVVWTNSLHNRFLHAINHIGLEKAVPKRILEFMNVPGLTRENVASHLQKYRIFLKRVADKGSSSLKNLSESSFISTTFPSSNGILTLKDIQQEYSQFPGQDLARTSFQPGFGTNVSTVGSSIPSLLCSPSKEASSTSDSGAYQAQYGQSHSLSNATNFLQSIFGNTNPLYQANRKILGIESSQPNNTERTLSSNGVVPYGLTSATKGLTNGTSSMQLYQQQNQARSYLDKIGTLSHYQVSSSGTHGSNYVSGLRSMGTINSSYSSLNTNNSYAGIQMTNDGDFIGAGQLQLNGSELSSGFSGSQGLADLFRNDNINVVQKGNGASCYFAHGGPSSSGSESTNQFPSTFNSVNQEKPPVLPPLPQQLYDLENGGGERDYNVGQMNNIASDFDNLHVSNQQQPGKGDLTDILFDSTGYLPPYQQQVVEGDLNVNFPGTSFDSEVITTMPEFQNPDISSSYHVEGNTPWNEQSSGQLQGGEQVVNPNFGGNNKPLDEYFPSFEQQRGVGELMEAGIHGMYHFDNAAMNQNWAQELMDFMFGNDHYLGNGQP